MYQLVLCRLVYPCSSCLGVEGYAFRLVDQRMQVSVEAYDNAMKPSFAGEDLLSDWTIRAQLQVRFPK